MKKLRYIAPKSTIVKVNLSRVIAATQVEQNKVTATENDEETEDLNKDITTTDDPSKLIW